MRGGIVTWLVLVVGWILLVLQIGCKPTNQRDKGEAAADSVPYLGCVEIECGEMTRDGKTTRWLCQCQRRLPGDQIVECPADDRLACSRYTPTPEASPAE